MKINSKDFRVREGDEVDLRKRPTTVEPVHKSKEHYQKLLEGNRSVKTPGQAAERVRSRGFQFQGSSSAICRAG
jgi:hypothetical protein